MLKITEANFTLAYIDYSVAMYLWNDFKSGRRRKSTRNSKKGVATGTVVVEGCAMYMCCVVRN